MIRDRILNNMNEGVMTIGLDGKIMDVNPSASQILNIPIEDLLSKSFATCFMDEEKNDDFCQTVLDAIYDKDTTHHYVVNYYNGNKTIDMEIRTSFYKENDDLLGVIIIMMDVTELSELKNAVIAMNEIKRLNDQLQIRNEIIYKAFGRYMSDSVAKELLDKPDGLDIKGRKANLTIIISDLRGYTTMSEHMTIEDLINMLNNYLMHMAKIIEDNHGTIIELLGDGILAIFGAPKDDKDHAFHAVKAAIDMQNEMKNINEWNRKNGYIDLQMGIGVNTGDVIVGNIGSSVRTKYTVIGSNVNLTGRIESYTTGGQILVSEKTCNSIGDRIVTGEESIVYPKGVATPVTIKEVFSVDGISNENAHAIYPKKLEKAIELMYKNVNEKHVDIDTRICKLNAICNEGALISADNKLEKFDNLVIEINDGEQLFAKVMNDEYLIKFTGKPACFNEWIDGMEAKQ